MLATGDDELPHHLADFHEFATGFKLYEGIFLRVNFAINESG